VLVLIPSIRNIEFAVVVKEIRNLTTLRISIQPFSFPKNRQGDTKKRELLKNPTKIEEIQEKKIIDRN